jgi:hypothetical protein
VSETRLKMPEKDTAFNDQVQIHSFHHTSHHHHLQQAAVAHHHQQQANAAHSHHAALLHQHAAAAAAAAASASMHPSHHLPGHHQNGTSGPSYPLQLPSAFVAFHSPLPASLVDGRYLWDPTTAATTPSSFHHPSHG